MKKRISRKPGGPGTLLARRDLSVLLYEQPGGQARLEGSDLSPDHLISLRLVVDPVRARVTAADGEMSLFPCRRCPRALRRVKGLSGLRVGVKSIETVTRRLGGPEGCLHLQALGRLMMETAAEALIGHREGFGLMGSRNGDLFEEFRRELVEKHWKGQCVAYPEGEEDVCRECLECTHPCARGQRRRAKGLMIRRPAGDAGKS